MTIYRRPHDLPAHLACWRCNLAEAITPAGLCLPCREQLINADPVRASLKTKGNQ